MSDRKLVFEYDGTGSLNRRYVYGQGWAPVQVRDPNGTGEDVYAVHVDHLDTPVRMTDVSGTLVWSAEYEGFGEASVDEDPDADLVDVTLNIRFPGQYYDTETGLHYNRYRYYDPTLGRYISADPIGQVAGPNLYQYAENNPTNRTDPYGLFSAWEATLAAGNFATGVADAASLGLGPLARDYLEDNYGAGGNVDECSDSYAAGELASLVLGGGRLAYAGAAKAISRFASSGAAASAGRNALKRVARGGAFPNYRTGSYAGKHTSDDALRAAAGRTSDEFNAAGANLAAGGAAGAANNCDCSSQNQ